jgi:hypothetical protein
MKLGDGPVLLASAMLDKVGARVSRIFGKHAKTLSENPGDRSGGSNIRHVRAGRNAIDDVIGYQRSCSCQ